jgi:hypothetical protein
MLWVESGNQKASNKGLTSRWASDTLPPNMIVLDTSRMMCMAHKEPCGRDV